MKATDRQYQQSNAITEVALTRFSKKEYKAFLNAGETSASRQKLAQALIDYLCKKFRMPAASVRVVNRAQPHAINAAGRLQRKTFGSYAIGGRTITLYNLTAVKKQTVSIKSMLDTLLHEFMHHYDMTYLKLGASIHSAGFYKRISDLDNKLK